MTFQEFADNIAYAVQQSLKDTMQVTITTINKNNGVVLTGLLFKSDELRISPTIYLESFYEEYLKGISLGNIVTEIIQVYSSSRIDKNIDVSFFLNYSIMKKRLAFKLINYDKNLELLKEIPYLKFLDLAIVFYCNIEEEELGKATILIHNQHMDSWKVTVEQLYQDALNNTPKLFLPELCPIEEILLETLAQQKEVIDISIEDIWPPETPISMYILSNQERVLGAASVLYPDFLKSFSDNIEENLFILPSSIHEVILIPDTGKEDSGQLLEMVKEVNATQVEEQEILSDSVYYYDRKLDKMEKIR